MRAARDRAADAGTGCGRARDDGACRWTTAIVRRRRLRRTCSTGSSRRGRPNRKWIADFTYIWTAEGWLYVAAVLDLFSRRVVGWSMSAAMTAQLVTDALMMAIWRRGQPRELLHHSDRGSQYTSEQFQRLMADHGVTCCLSRSGNVWDNAAMESFFSSLKTERMAGKVVPHARPGQGRRVRLHRALLQPQTQALDARLSQPDGVRTEGAISLGWCPPNRQQLRRSLDSPVLEMTFGSDMVRVAQCHFS